MTQNNFPDFLIIGAGKCGTTSIDKYLKQHPDIFMSTKEPGFFALDGKEIVDPKDDPLMFHHYPNGVYKLDHYLGLFEKAHENQLKGDTSPIYLYDKNAPANIKKYVPNAKLIAIVRQPVDRLYSRFLHLANEDRLPTNDFKDALDRDTLWWKKNDLVQEGFYHCHLTRYFELFEKDNIKVFLYEDFQKNPVNLMKEIFAFLGIREEFQPDLSIRYNQNGFIKNKLIDKIIGKRSGIKKGISKVLPGLYSKFKRNPYLKKRLYKLRGMNLSRPPLDRELRKKMTHDIYKEDILKLQALTGKDLNHWLS
ncbi:sulfotransferase [Fulvivirga sp. M361]|uniref:sulfotransferase family protein n=1 Tax=Fulvivirga sp. M361 TaxID=2594266 RepID=UPI0011798C49|nr:sulfotransferase [Fulvivirga sp. M361]TRX60107.1 sulfotransferase [Fulvivirga sp. M361]